MSRTLITALWSVLGFASGSLPWSLWVGRLFTGLDVRSFGDRNPGAANAWKAGGWRVGMVAVLLDMGKGTLPVFLAITLSGINHWALVPVGLAPIAGHAFSPALGFKGGKAHAVSVGVWAAATTGMAVPVLVIWLGISYALQKTDGWTVMFGGFGVLVLLLLRYPEPHLFLLWAGNMGILTYKLQDDLRMGVVPRPWVLRVLRRAT